MKLLDTSQLHGAIHLQYLRACICGPIDAEKSDTRSFSLAVWQVLNFQEQREKHALPYFNSASIDDRCGSIKVCALHDSTLQFANTTVMYSIEQPVHFATRSTILTIRLGRRSYRLVSTKTVGMRVESRIGSRRQGAPLVHSGRVFLWSGALGSRKACRPRVVHRSLNPAFPGHQNESCWSGPDQRTTTMSAPAFGDNVTRLFDPDREVHHALSENSRFELSQLFDAIDAVATLVDTPPHECGPEITPSHLSPLFFSFARLGHRILAETQNRFPQKVERKPR